MILFWKQVCWLIKGKTELFWGHLCIYLGVVILSVKPHLQTLDNGVSVLSLVVDHFDVVQVGICPVHQAIDQV